MDRQLWKLRLQPPGQTNHASQFAHRMIDHNHGKVDVDGKGRLPPIDEPVVGANCQVGLVVIDELQQRRHRPSADAYPGNGLIVWADELHSVLAEGSSARSHLTGHIERGSPGNIVDPVIPLPINRRA